MKKIFKSTILCLLCTLLVIPTLGFSKADFKEMKEALKKANIKIDLENGKSVEQVIKNDKGEEIGVLGIEEVASEPEISALGTWLPAGTYKTGNSIVI